MSRVEVAVGDQVKGIAGRDIVTQHDGCRAVPEIMAKMTTALVISNLLTAGLFFGVGYIVAHSAGKLRQALALAGCF